MATPASDGLTQLLDGRLAFLKPRLALAADPRSAVAGVALGDPAAVRTLVARYGETYPGEDVRAIASLWSKWLFATVLEPVLAANLLADWALPTGFGEVGLILGTDGRPEVLKLAHGGGACSPRSADERFAGLIDGFLAPAIATLAAATGIAPRVLWSNVGNYVEHALKRVEAATGPDWPGVVQGYDLLASRRRGDGRPNPLFEPVTYGEGGNARRRRVCCIRYLIPGQAYCGACPIVRRDEAPAGRPA
ncbi:Ferric iron reductase protein FhuF [bacterium YEK0313]|nr:Ferric iron reductase protein FhuF [bacterium YEK0313]